MIIFIHNNSGAKNVEFEMEQKEKKCKRKILKWYGEGHFISKKSFEGY